MIFFPVVYCFDFYSKNAIYKISVLEFNYAKIQHNVFLGVWVSISWIHYRRKQNKVKVEVVS